MWSYFFGPFSALCAFAHFALIFSCAFVPLLSFDMSGAAVEFRTVSKSFTPHRHVLDRISFRVEPGETLVLLGSSGSGKTTTLKMMNRLVSPDDGEVLVEGKEVRSWDPIRLRRRLGYVIQEVGLLPHLSVEENVALVPRLEGWELEKRRSRAHELLDVVGLPPQEFRAMRPSQLSGGQRQRVGVARALANDPPILLMDEPFGALDPITRRRLQEEFRKLEGELGKTVVFVTHDVPEALRLADRIAIMDEGRIRQIGSPREILDSPADDFVKEFVRTDLVTDEELSRLVDDEFGKK
jgi:osmoprotectant transport system ATP-binding protein